MVFFYILYENKLKCFKGTKKDRIRSESIYTKFPSSLSARACWMWHAKLTKEASINEVNVSIRQVVSFQGAGLNCGFGCKHAQLFLRSDEFGQFATHNNRPFVLALKFQGTLSRDRHKSSSLFKNKLAVVVGVSFHFILWLK